MDRALPGWAVDLIRDGVNGRDLSAGGDRAVWRALVRTAASAHQRGQDRMEWQALVEHPASRLGVQVRLEDGRRPRKPLAVSKTLEAAWETGWVWASEQPPAHDRYSARREAEARAAAVMALCGDADAALDDAQRAVLAHAADRARALGSITPALPRQPMAEAVREATGLGLTALRTALTRLEAAGLLVLTERGRPRGDLSKRRAVANLYRLPDEAALAAATPYLYRETRSVVPPRQVCGAPAPHAPGAPRQVCGAPAPTTNQPAPEETAMDTVTITAASPEALARLLDLLRREGAAVEAATPSQEGTAAPADLPPNVVPLHREQTG